MRDWLIKKLGGYTEDEYIEGIHEQTEYFSKVLEIREATIRKLQALVPVSAVLPKKKRGRPRKYART